MAAHIIAAVQCASEVIKRTKQAKEGMDAITSRDAPDTEVDHGNLFDALNLDDPTQLSPGHQTQELSFFQSVLSKTFGDEPESTTPSHPSNDSMGIGM